MLHGVSGRMCRRERQIRGGSGERVWRKMRVSNAYAYTNTIFGR